MILSVLFEFSGDVERVEAALDSFRGAIISQSVLGFPACSVGFLGHKTEARGPDWSYGQVLLEVVDIFGNGHREIVSVGQREVLMQTRATTRLDWPGLVVDFKGAEQWLDGSLKRRK